MKPIKKAEYVVPGCVLLTGFFWIFIAEELGVSGVPSLAISTPGLYRDVLFVAIVSGMLFYFLRKHRWRSTQSVREYHALFDSNPVPMWIFDPATLAFLDVNAAAIKHYGYSRASFLAMTLKDIRPASEHVALEESINRIGANTRDEMVWKHLKQNGDIIFVQVTADNVFFKKRVCRLAVANDITETLKAEERRKIAEQRSREALASFETLCSATNDAIRNWDMVQNKVRWNRGLLQTFGYDVEKTSVAWWFRRVHESDRPMAKQAIREIARGVAHKWDMEYRFRCCNGNYKYVLDRSILMYDDMNRPARLIGVMQDINVRKEQEKEIQKLSLVAQKTSNGVLLCNNKGQIEWVNEAFINVSGYTLEEVKGKFAAALLHGEETDPAVEAEIMQQSALGNSITRQIINYKKNGQPHWIQLNLSPILINGHHEFTIALQTDITQLKMHEQKIECQNEQLRHIAFQTSHLVRAPLANILGLTAVIGENGHADKKNEELIELLSVSAGQLDTVIRNIVAQTIQINADQRGALAV